MTTEPTNYTPIQQKIADYLEHYLYAIKPAPPHVSQYTLRCFVGMLETGEATIDDFRATGGDRLAKIVQDGLQPAQEQISDHLQREILRAKIRLVDLMPTPPVAAPGADDHLPITEDWLLSLGFQRVESDMGRNYPNHLECGALNVYNFNDTGNWLWNQYDSIEMRKRGELRTLAKWLKVDIGQPAKGPE